MIGDGNGVISARGPRPGEEYAEPGDRELAVYCDGESAELRLVLRNREVVDSC